MLKRALMKISIVDHAIMKFSSAEQNIEVNSNDEVGEVARSFNTYLKSQSDLYTSCNTCVNIRCF